MRNHEKPDDPDGHSLDLLASSTSTFGRLLPFTNATFWFGERPLVGESRHSSTEFICSVRPSLNDRSRLEAALQLTTKKSR